MGLVKPLVFGLLLIWIAVAKGFFLHLEKSGGFGAEARWWVGQRGTFPAATEGH
jgi:hypothetical protein